MKHEYIFILNGIIHVLQYKASENSKLGFAFVVQTYHFAPEQLKDFTKDSKTCMDCPMSYNQNNGKSGGCYTHKGKQLMGLKSMLKRISKLKITEFNQSEFNAWVKRIRVTAHLVRFGTYGEPTTLPVSIIRILATLGEKTTGYTHQWRTANPEYSNYFMSSTHSIEETEQAQAAGYRSFILIKTKTSKATVCPASKEASRRLTCSECGLCNGNSSSFKKDIYINKH